jgi:hypothetical protein
MDTKAWGPPMWDSLFHIALGFDLNPSKIKVGSYKAFFGSLADVLPCKYCRASLHEFLGIIRFTDYAAQRYGAMRFVYDLKNMVNAKLVSQGNRTARAPPFSAVVARYERYVAVCSRTRKTCRRSGRRRSRRTRSRTRRTKRRTSRR